MSDMSIREAQLEGNTAIGKLDEYFDPKEIIIVNIWT